MDNSYTWLKYIHILATILWVGSSFTMGMVSSRILRSGDRNTLLGFFTATQGMGPSLIGGSSIVVLLTGIAMAVSADLFRATWVHIGFAGILIHFVFGPVVMRKAAMRFHSALANERSDPALLQSMAGRMQTLNAIYLAVLFTVIAAMVFKPMAA